MSVSQATSRPVWPFVIELKVTDRNLLEAKILAKSEMNFENLEDRGYTSDIVFFRQITIFVPSCGHSFWVPDPLNDRSY